MAALKKDVSNICTELTTRVARLKDQLKAVVKSLPVADGVVRVPGHPNCAIVSSSTVFEHGGNLSPRYYLGLEQSLFDIIDRTSVNKLESVMDNILTEGSFPCKDRGRGRIHPKALEALRKSWDDQRDWEV